MTLPNGDTERQLRHLRAQVAELEAKISSLSKVQAPNGTAQTEHEEEEEFSCPETTLFRDDQDEFGRLEAETVFEEDKDCVVSPLHADRPLSSETVPQATLTSDCEDPLAIDGGEGVTESSLKRKHLCSDCGKGFKYGCDMLRHAVIHTQVKPNLCSVCGKAFRLPGSLRRHMKIHTGEKNYKCAICDKCYSRNETLKVHMRSHTGERPHKCGMCGKGFVTKSKVTKHVRTHLRKPHMCQYCKKCFSSELALQSHNHDSENRGLQYNDGRIFTYTQVETHSVTSETGGCGMGTSADSITSQGVDSSHLDVSNLLVRRVREDDGSNGHVSLVLGSLMPGNDHCGPQFSSFNRTSKQEALENSHQPRITNDSPPQEPIGATPLHRINSNDPPLESIGATLLHRGNHDSPPQEPIGATPLHRIDSNDHPLESIGVTPLHRDNHDSPPQEPIGATPLHRGNHDSPPQEPIGTTPLHRGNHDSPPQEPIGVMPLHRINGEYSPQEPVNATPHQRLNDTPYLGSDNTLPQSACEENTWPGDQNTHSNPHPLANPEIEGLVLDTVFKEDLVSADIENTSLDGGPVCSRHIPSETESRNASPTRHFPNITIVTFPGNSPPPCPICNKLFSEASDLTKHMYVHMNKSLNTCDICKRTFPSTSELAVHDCSIDRLFRCSKCSETFVSFCALESHAKVHHGRQRTKDIAKMSTKSYKCGVCDKMFCNASSLIVHNRSHTGERPFCCSFCDVRFVSSSACAVHTRKHTGERPFSCKFCDQKFFDSSSRTIHTRMHTGDKPYQCQFCVKRFPTQSRLTVHVRTHTGERPYECPVCGHGFPRKFVLTVHMRTHTGEKPFKCEHCEKSFTCSVDRRRHMEDVHEGRRLKCGECGLEFKRSAFNRHVRVKHKASEDCVGDITESVNNE